MSEVSAVCRAELHDVELGNGSAGVQRRVPRPRKHTDLDGQNQYVDVLKLGHLAQMLELLPGRAPPSELHTQRQLVHVRDVSDGLFPLQNLLSLHALGNPQLDVRLWQRRQCGVKTDRAYPLRCSSPDTCMVCKVRSLRPPASHEPSPGGGMRHPPPSRPALARLRGPGLRRRLGFRPGPRAGRRYAHVGGAAAPRCPGV